MSLHHLVGEEADSQARKLNYPFIVFLIGWSMMLRRFQTYLADSKAESLSPVEDSDMVGHLLPQHQSWAWTDRALDQVQAVIP